MSKMPSPPFDLGEVVWVAWTTAYRQTEVPCPICFGKRVVTLILGNGEHQPVECDWCRRGIGEPTGIVYCYTAHSEVKERTVTGVVHSSRGWRIEVDGHSADIDCIFRDPESAEARRAVLYAEAEQQTKQNFESQFKMMKKKSTWTVGHHRREIQELRQRLEWHEAKLGKGSEL